MNLTYYRVIGVLIVAASFAVCEDPVSVQELSALQAQFEQLIEEKVTDPYYTALGLLDSRYSKAVDDELRNEKAAGRLDSVLALQKEQERLVSGLDLPIKQTDTPEVLTRLRSTYESEAARIEALKEDGYQSVYNPYVAKLKTLEIELTRLDQLDQAIRVKEYRESLVTFEQPSKKPEEQNVTDLPTSIDAVIQLIPESLLDGLENPLSMDASVEEINRFLTEQIVNQQIEITTAPKQVDSASTGTRKFRLQLPTGLVSDNNLGIIGGNFWAMFSPNSSHSPQDFSVGTVETLTGRITRCKLTRVDDVCKFHMDVKEAQILERE